MLSPRDAIHDAVYLEISSPAGHMAFLGGWTEGGSSDKQRHYQIRKFLSTLKWRAYGQDHCRLSTCE